MIAPEVERLLEACPFLKERLDAANLDLPTVAFGETAQLVMARTLPSHEEERVFSFFNMLADDGTSDELEVLGTGAIELFNDDAASQRLAQAKLTGAALQMLEDFRISWGQPDYGAKP